MNTEKPNSQTKDEIYYITWPIQESEGKKDLFSADVIAVFFCQKALLTLEVRQVNDRPSFGSNKNQTTKYGSLINILKFTCGIC